MFEFQVQSVEYMELLHRVKKTVTVNDARWSRQWHLVVTLNLFALQLTLLRAHQVFFGAVYIELKYKLNIFRQFVIRFREVNDLHFFV